MTTNTITKTIPKSETKIDKPIKRCVDCDSDCWDVAPHYLSCWLGVCSTGNNIGIADGLCPFLTDEVPLPPKE